jgi:hypothetical protein
MGRRSAPTQCARFHGAWVTIAKEPEEAVSLLGKNHINGMLASRHSLESFLSTQGKAPYELAHFNIATVSVGIALQGGNPLIIPRNEVILQMPTQIRFQEIRDTWHRHLHAPRDRDLTSMSDSPAP